MWSTRWRGPAPCVEVAPPWQVVSDPEAGVSHAVPLSEHSTFFSTSKRGYCLLRWHFAHIFHRARSYLSWTPVADGAGDWAASVWVTITERILGNWLTNSLQKGPAWSFLLSQLFQQMQPANTLNNTQCEKPFHRRRPPRSPSTQSPYCCCSQ